MNFNTNLKSKINAAVNTLKQLVVFTMIFSMVASAAEKAPTASLPLPTTGNVTLTLAEYDRLVDLGSKAARKHEVPPVSYTLKRAELKLRVADTAVLGSIQLDGEVFGKGTAKVPLVSGMTILNARQEGPNGKLDTKALPLLQEGSTATAVLPGPAEFSVALDAGMPMNIEAGRASFYLPVPAAGSVRLSLVIPGDHTNVRISPGLITNKTSANGQTTVEAALTPGQPATIWWQTREIVVPVVPKEVRFLSDVKTLISVTESDLHLAALVNVTVVQGDPTEFKIIIPKDYEISDVSGSTVEGSEIADDELIVKLNNSSPRSHQFLVTMEKPLEGAVKMETPFLNFKDAQRETGEVLVEGSGAMELTSTEAGSLKRMDVKEVSPYLRSLAHYPMHAAFRFHRQPAPDGAPKLDLSWVRFPDSNVLAAIAERAVVTTLVTNEGRSLTEVKLTLRNQAQPFLKVDLPKDATILSAEVAGVKVKPVLGTDGSRVPLLRAGFRPTDSYEVSFVFMHSGTPFAKKGGSDIELPSMDIPISLLQWEVFLPEQYKVKDFGGDAIAMDVLQPVTYVRRTRKDEARVRESSEDRASSTFDAGQISTFAGVAENEGIDNLALFVPDVMGGSPGTLVGTVTDSQGAAVIPRAQVRLTNISTGVASTTTTDSSGTWRISGLPSGTYRAEISAQYFKTSVLNGINYSAGQGASLGNTKLMVGSTSTTVEVAAAAPLIDTAQSQVTNTFSGSNLTTLPSVAERRGKGDKELERDAKKQAAQVQMQASVNVFNLQKKVSGVLPVQVDVPRAGNSYKFARALVLDEETKLTFNYKTK